MSKVDWDKLSLRKEDQWFQELSEIVVTTCREHNRGVLMVPFSDFEAIMEDEEKGIETHPLLCCAMDNICIAPAICSLIEQAAEAGALDRAMLKAITHYIKKHIMKEE